MDSSRRLDILLESIKHQFEAAVHENTVLRSQRDAAESKLVSKLNEICDIKKTLFDLDANHMIVRQLFETETLKLRNELQHIRLQARDPLHPPGLSSVALQPSLLEQHFPPPFQPQLSDPAAGSSSGSQDTAGQAHLPQQLFHSGSIMNYPSQRPLLHTGKESHTQQPGTPPLFRGNVLAESSKHGDGWAAYFNPHVPRVMDVDMVHMLEHDSPVCCVRFSADGRFLATGCDGAAHIYNVKTGRRVCVLVHKRPDEPGHLYIRCVCFSPDGKSLATGGEDKRIWIWDTESGQPLTLIFGHKGDILSLYFNLDGTILASGSEDGTVRMWNMKLECRTVLAAHTATASVAISPDGRFVAAGSVDAIIRIWDTSSEELVEYLEGHTEAVSSVAFTSDGKRLVTSSLDKTIRLWDIAPLYAPLNKILGASDGNGKDRCVCLLNYRGHRDHVYSTAASHDGRWIVSGSRDCDVQVWDKCNSASLVTLRHNQPIFSIDLNPTIGVLATGGQDGRARLWRFARLCEQNVIV